MSIRSIPARFWIPTETASAIFTAHYDTPAASFLPNVMTPRNKPFYWAYQMLQVGILVALGCAVGVPLAVISGVCT